MSASLPASVDAERMVAGRRAFEGVLAVAELPRLAAALANDRGEVAYRLDFETGGLDERRLHVRLRAALTLRCQRSLELFVYPVEIDSWLGLLADEGDAGALPADCEPLLLESGQLSPRRVIVDELLLALPLVPSKPGSEVLQGAWNAPAASSRDAEQGDGMTHPFADLRRLLETRTGGKR